MLIEGYGFYFSSFTYLTTFSSRHLHMNNQYLSNNINSLPVL